MYKVVLIDDEIWGIRSINSSFNWSENGFEVVGEYTDAEEAIEEIKDDRQKGENSKEKEASKDEKIKKTTRGRKKKTA